MWWHVFQCVKPKTFDEQRLLGPARPQAALFMQLPRDRDSVPAALWKRNRLHREHRGYGLCAHPQTALAFSQTLGKKPTSQTNIPIFQGPAATPPLSHVLALQQGDECQHQTWLSKHPNSWDICLHAGVPTAKLLLLVHLSISQEKSFLCTVPCVICWIKFFLISRPKPKEQPLEQTRFCANIISTSPLWN